MLPRPDHQNVAGHEELGGPAESVEIKLPTSLQVVDGKGDEADPLVHAPSISHSPGAAHPISSSRQSNRRPGTEIVDPAVVDRPCLRTTADSVSKTSTRQDRKSTRLNSRP